MTSYVKYPASCLITSACTIFSIVNGVIGHSQAVHENFDPSYQIWVTLWVCIPHSLHSEGRASIQRVAPVETWPLNHIHSWVYITVYGNLIFHAWLRGNTFRHFECPQHGIFIMMRLRHRMRGRITLYWSSELQQITQQCHYMIAVSETKNNPKQLISILEKLLSAIREYPWCFKHVGSDKLWSKHYMEVEMMLDKAKSVPTPEVR